MKRVLYLSLMVFAFASCKKDNTSFTNPSATKATFSATMNGSRIWMGWASNLYTVDPPDAFTRFSILAVNDKAIVVFGDTLKYVGYDANTHLIEYTHDNYSSFVRTLHFNTLDLSMELYTSSKGGDEVINTKDYIPNNLLEKYIGDISGLKVLSGTAYDTFVMRHPMDSMYSINTTIKFIAINDSTIAIENDVIKSDTLHFKLTDNAAKTIIFQNFHSYYFDVSTLTYNYATKSLVFEQQSRSTGWWKYLKLQ